MLKIIPITLLALGLAHCGRNKGPQAAAKKSATADLRYKQYDNTDWAFKFEYPGYYILHADSARNSVQLFDSSTWKAVQAQTPSDEGSSMSFTRFELAAGKTALDWAKANVPVSNYHGQAELIQVDGRDALSYSYSQLGWNDFVLVADTSKRVLYLFSAGSSGENMKLRNDFRAIVNTVSF